LTWNESGCDDFKASKATRCHVYAGQLAAYQSKFNGTVNVTFVGDLPAPTPTAVDEIESSSLQGGDRGRLILRDGQILILRDGKTYTLTGAQVR